ncbi:glycosyltransferase [Candidatus Pelagibacter sp.]|nr:glycosyltransferase [Candidatus Pelagibacter sp.]
MKNNLSIIIPILNEKNNILPLTTQIIKNLKKFKFEIIFVDDSSLDGSVKLLIELKKKFKFFKPIFRKKKRDLSQSCFDGINKSKFENILVMDGDLQHNPKYIKNMIKLIDNKDIDIVVGARRLWAGKNKGLSEIRRFASVVLIYFFKIFNIKTNDPMSGFFLFKKKIFIKNKKFLFGKGFKILADILINSKENLIVKDISINFDRRYESKSKMNYKVLLIIIYFYLRSIFKKLINF